MSFILEPLWRRGTAPLVALAWAAALSVLVATPNHLAAQENKGPVAELRILAVVNDEPISAFDLNQRLNFIIRLSRLEDSIKTRRQLAPRVLRALVDETLKLQEAKSLNINVSEAELNRALARVERQNRLKPGQLQPFLKSRGILPDTLIRQIKAAIAWPAVIRRKFLRSVVVSEEEVDKTLAQFKAAMNKPSHLAAEIFLPVDDPNEDSRIRQNAENILNELRQGASFALLARQFSQSDSARDGGDLGWVKPGELPPDVEAELAKLEPGEVSAPIRTAAGYHILYLRERRAASELSSDATVVLRQILLPVPADAPKSDWESQATLARTIKETASGCADFSSISRELGSQLSGNLGRVKISELPAELQKTVSTIPVGKASEPFRVEEGLRVIMVCDRSEKTSKLPSRARVRRIVQGRHLERRAQRHLRDLRQSGIIEIRTLR
ncbi:MAG TPA: peptidylprolyl isomerase [Alphaproteobacteria bacterium]|nr:peptidylprolyl isomerase [Alphaproteobacteria bacterium]